MTATECSEADGVRERASLRATVAVFAFVASVVLVGVVVSEGWPREAANWARRDGNGVLVDAGGVLVGVAGIVFTVALLVLTRQSVRAAARSAEGSARSAEVADAALAEAREQRKKDLVPVVVLTSYSEMHYPRPSTDSFMSLGGPWWERGVRIANSGPGVALHVARTWSGAWMADNPLVDVTNDQPPMYLASGAQHDIRIEPGPDLRGGWSKTPEEYPGAILTKSTDVGVGTITIRYRDIYNQPGRTWCRVLLKSRDGRGEVVCEGIEIRLPGEGDS